jgi:hypothetical protein
MRGTIIVLSVILALAAAQATQDNVCKESELKAYITSSKKENVADCGAFEQLLTFAGIEANEADAVSCTGPIVGDANAKGASEAKSTVCSAKKSGDSPAIVHIEIAQLAGNKGLGAKKGTCTLQEAHAVVTIGTKIDIPSLDECDFANPLIDLVTESNANEIPLTAVGCTGPRVATKSGDFETICGSSGDDKNPAVLSFHISSYAGPTVSKFKRVSAHVRKAKATDSE